MKKSIILSFIISLAFFLGCKQVEKGGESRKNYSRYILATTSEIKPEGWIRQFLEIQKEGLTGNIAAAGAPFDSKMWIERIELDKTTQKESINSFKREGKGEDADKGIFWWPYEQTGYYIDGAIKCGYLLGDSILINRAEKQINYLLNNPKKNNRLGPPAKLIGRWNVWPYAGLFRSFLTEFSETSDQRIIEAMYKHYLTYTAEDFQDELDVCNVEHLCWLYEKTGDENLLATAEEAYALFKSDKKNRTRGGADMIFESDRVPDQHGVVYFEVVKIPAILYMHTGKQEYLDEALHGIQKMEQHFMLPSGCPSTTEHFHEVNEMAGHETCNHATLPYTYGIMLRATGDPKWADKIEKAAYNAALGSITKDFKSHQYFSAPNQMIASLKSNHFGYYGDFMAYAPGHSVACCTGNINRFMPYFAMQMWLKTNNNGVVASLFGASEFSTTVGSEKVKATIKQITKYPFEEKVKFEIHLDEKAEFAFQIRIPAWCSNPMLTVNGYKVEGKLKPGTFYTLKRKFADGDVVELFVPMEVKKKSWFGKGLSFERGPIVFSYPVPTTTVIEEDYEKSTKDFPAYSFYPNGKWQYAPVVNNLKNVEIVLNENYSYPWDISTPPVKLIVKAQEVKNWNLAEVVDDKSRKKVLKNPEFPEGLKLSDKTETIELVPYGSTVLRLTVFPEK
ncbi:beta-L-arabinofuranosidase domain-containing protein [Marinilabilia rubra]|uniref:Glycosyl hydrolase n=1 Tax=Marinilabilia rubra TaxID=2162893 RepID=A0A2U2BC58_9BACT|nr:beta-L-arabinofuranosidase domain-containing protein [Marinilabilia rubra]PWE00617.1 hypothetical protein DDZ16_03185 [Marinilabilia rubra]